MPDENANISNTDNHANAEDPVLEQLAHMLADGEATNVQPFSDPHIQTEPFVHIQEDSSAEQTAVADSRVVAPASAGSPAMTEAQQRAYEQAYAQAQQTFGQTQGVDAAQAAQQPQVAQQPQEAQQLQQPQEAPSAVPTQPYAEQGYADQTPYVQPAPPHYAQTGPNPGTTPMVLGILSIVFAGLVGLVLSILAIKKSGNVTKTYGENSRAKAGKITGIIGLVLSILAMLFALVITIGAAYLAYTYDDEELASYIEDVLVESDFVSQDAETSSVFGSGAAASTTNDTDENTSSVDTAESEASSAEAATATGAYAPDSEEEAAAIEVVNKSFEDLKDPRSSIRAEIAQEMEDIFDDGETGLKDLGISGDEFAGWILDDIRYTAQDATLFDTGDGWVDVTVESRDFNSFYDKLDELVFAFNDEGGFKDMSSEDVNAKMGEFFRSAMEQTDKVEKDVMFDVTKNGDAWEVDEDSLWFALDSILFGY